MNDITFIEILTHWFSGEAVNTQLYLWGIKLIWWGRVSKALQYVAALFVIGEVLGPERLRNFGSGLRNRFPRERGALYLRRLVAWLRALKQYYAAPLDTPRQAEARKDVLKFPEFRLNLYVALVLAGVVMIRLINHVPGIDVTTFTILGVALTAFLAIFLTPMVTALALLLFTAGGVFLNDVLLAQFANALENENINLRLKIVSLLVLTFGFFAELILLN
jgi:hypothetical protein